VSEMETLRATAHPLRLRIISLLTGAAMSAAEVARELDVTQANASYHLRLLERAGLIRVVEEERIRGGIARRYRFEPSSQPSVTRDIHQHLGAEAHGPLFAALASAMRERGTRWAPGPGVNTDADMWVSPDVWQQVVNLVGQASDLVHASAQPSRTKGTVHVSMSAALFCMDDGGRTP
jgi:DNA-binding transcriptional ArsR family regulator